jgi:nicotinamidase/pyrazinamidase
MQNNAALLVVDVQNDFCRGGALAVPDGEAAIPLINRIAGKFTTVVLTQDWHPGDHTSFAANHPGAAPFETVQMPYGSQTLWPTHCVMATPGAALHPALNIPHAAMILRKGLQRHVDSYSAFLEADRITRTGLDGFFASRGITEIFFAGLAMDFCVAWSAEDAQKFGFRSTVIEDACRAIDLNDSLRRAWERLTEAGVRRMASTDLPAPRAR